METEIPAVLEHMNLCQKMFLIGFFSLIVRDFCVVSINSKSIYLLLLLGYGIDSAFVNTRIHESSERNFAKIFS